jgi:large subunit ribosomal protein L22
MDIKAEQKYLLLSPRKLRPVADIIKKLTPTQAVERLPFVGKRGAEPLAKVIKQAIANARVKGLSDADLTFKEIQIGEGPRLKRGIPVSRGQWHPIKRRMSHIRVVLTTRKPEIQNPKLETKPKNESSKTQNKKGNSGTKN